MEEEKSNVQEEKTEKPVKKKEKISNKKTLTDKMRENPWIISTLVLGILTLILLVGNFSGSVSRNVISKNDAGEALLNFANNQGAEAELVDVEDIGDFYEVTLMMDGQNLPLMVTKDGEYFLSGGLVSLDVIQKTDSQPTPQTSEYSEEDLEKLKTFSSCLAEKGLIIYGANWCGWTKKLVIDTLGGFNIAGDAYVECEENKELCASEGIQGYPTIKLNGESYSGERTLKALGEATECIVPELEGTGAIASSSDASCS